MKPILLGNNVRASCPDCNGAITNFVYRDESREFGYILSDLHHTYLNRPYNRIVYRLLKCNGCGRAGISKTHESSGYTPVFEWFFPTGLQNINIPDDTPPGVVNEFREAEKCASVEAWRGGAAMLRSTLEKILTDHGYIERYLSKNIKAAGDDGVITVALQKRASEVIKVLGDDVLHKDWREVTSGEFDDAHAYTQRIIECFYDSPSIIKDILTEKGRIAKEEPLTPATK